MDFFRGLKVPSKFAREFLFFSTCLGHIRDEDFLVDRKSFDDNLIMYVLSGKMHVEQNGHHILTPRKGIMLRLTERHKYYTDKEDICEFIWIHFNGRQCEALLKLLDETCKLPVIFEEAHVEELIRQCFTIYNSNESDVEFLISEKVYCILMTILHSVCSNKEQVISDQETEFMNKAIRYIEDNLYSKTTLDDFAKHFNISRYHFCRIFEKVFHVSPMKYVLMKKIEISKYMLTYTNDTITGIAASLSFVDQSHFSKAFKALEGISPAQFRKM